MAGTYEVLQALDPDPGRFATEDPRVVPGDHVKVGFRVDPRHRTAFDPASEWMWVEVTAVEGTGPAAAYRGELCNRPFFIAPTVLRLGQPVTFRPADIHTVVRDSPDRPEGEREGPPWLSGRPKR